MHKPAKNAQTCQNTAGGTCQKCTDLPKHPKTCQGSYLNIATAVIPTCQKCTDLPKAGTDLPKRGRRHLPKMHIPAKGRHRPAKTWQVPLFHPHLLAFQTQSCQSHKSKKGPKRTHPERRCHLSSVDCSHPCFIHLLTFQSCQSHKNPKEDQRGLRVMKKEVVTIDLIVVKSGESISRAIQNFDIDICKCSWDGLGSFHVAERTHNGGDLQPPQSLGSYQQN